MTTTDETLIIILCCLMSLFFILLTVLVIMSIQLMKSMKRVAVKAENVVDSVEEAAEVFKDTSGKMGLFKIIRNIIQLTQDKKGRK